MTNSDDKKKQADVSFLQAFNRPQQFTPGSAGAWGLMKSRMKQVEYTDGVADGKDGLEIKKEEKEIKSDGSDKFYAAPSPEKIIQKDGMDSFNTEDVKTPHGFDFFDNKKEEIKGNKVDKWERQFQPKGLPGEDMLVSGGELRIEAPTKDIFTETSDGNFSVQIEKTSALHLQILDIITGLEKRAITFEKREAYIKEAENYIERKKRSFRRFNELQTPGIDRVRYYLNRGFEIFSQSLGELRMYLKDDSPIHLRIGRDLSREGNNIIIKAKEQMKAMKGGGKYV